MRFAEKLIKLMHECGLNQQRLARLAEVSDSEVSRIVTGKSYPGLENAFKLARAVNVSLDYLADDALDEDPMSGVPRPAAPTSSVITDLPEAEREILEIARSIGYKRTARILEDVRILGYEAAVGRLLQTMRPTIEVGDGSRPASNSSQSGPQTGRKMG